MKTSAKLLIAFGAASLAFIGFVAVVAAFVK
jgi:hypothetical protein